MPSRLVHQHQHEKIGEVIRYVLHKDTHHLSIGVRNDQRCHFPQSRTHIGVSVQIFSDDLPGGFGANTWWSPTSRRGSLIRPNLPSSWAMITAGLESSGSLDFKSLFTISGNFFKFLLAFLSRFQMGWPRHYFTPPVPLEESIEAGEVRRKA